MNCKPVDQTGKLELIIQLEQAFDAAYQKYGEPPAINLIDTTPEKLRYYLDTWGMINVVDVYNIEDVRNNYQRVIKELSLYLFNKENPHDEPLYEQEFNRISTKYSHFIQEEKEIATITLWWNSKNGFGNSSFRFLYHQYTKPEETPTVNIGGEKIYLSWNPYHRLALRVLQAYPKVFDLFKSLHVPNTAMISWDSQKIRFQEIGRGQSKGNQKSTKPTVTKRHRDIYNVDRIQAMLVHQDNEAIALGWVIFAQLPNIRNLLNRILGTNNVGFTNAEDPLLTPILNKYWRAPLAGLIVWTTHTVHYEGKPSINRKWERMPINADLDKISHRIVMGSQSITNLNQPDLTKLALLAEYGYQPSIYNNKNKGTKIDDNVVNRKSTQYRIPRKRSTYEIENFKTVESLLKSEYEINYVHSLPRQYQEMYGIYL